MRTVNTISLNGNVWQIEAEGCEALGAYLKGAESQPHGDPDRERDPRRSGTGHRRQTLRYVNAHKNVVTADEIALVLQEMGPVEAGRGADCGASCRTAATPGARNPAPPAAGDGPPGLAYGAGCRVAPAAVPDPRGRHAGGVCNGLAAYFGMDATLVRVIFVVVCRVHGRDRVDVYLVMLIVVPVAVTAEQMAAAHGKPFSAEELIGRGPRPALMPVALAAAMARPTPYVARSAAAMAPPAPRLVRTRRCADATAPRRPMAGRARPITMARRASDPWARCCTSRC